jgi:hypothetical protein
MDVASLRKELEPILLSGSNSLPHDVESHPMNIMMHSNTSVQSLAPADGSDKRNFRRD